MTKSANDRGWFEVTPGGPLSGTVSVPGDKSISHRAALFGGLLSRGISHIRGWLPAGDTLATLNAVQALGIWVERLDMTTLRLQGRPVSPPTGPLNLVNAGTGIRLLAGIAVGLPFPIVLDGSEQLRRRPMRRIIEPLRQMGAQISGVDDHAPLAIHPAPLHGIHYRLPVASAQVKSAILLAGLFAEGQTTVIEPGPARDHTEIMLQAMGASVQRTDNAVTIQPGALSPLDLTVPGDASSAAFPLVAAAILPGSAVTVTHVNMNPTRTGLFDVLAAMGADITINQTGTEAGEPVGDVTVRHSALSGTQIAGTDVVRMIDEFPALMVAATQAHGVTEVRDAAELRVKETDRIAVMAVELRKMGATIDERPDGFRIVGPQKLSAATVDGHDDHRIAMSLAIASLCADKPGIVTDAHCTADSFPGFAAVMRAVGAAIAVHGLDQNQIGSKK